ncbi:MAG TPA: hypothetical protein VMZ71_03560 [Gemmataceae bacterium]|nr:hypothetical protein [Gemmataceae bacterium]
MWRAAEAALQNLQNSATASRVESANARVKVAQKQAELEQALRDRGLAEVPGDDGHADRRAAGFRGTTEDRGGALDYGHR